ncbi:hypothetical protein DIPPA_07912 [Diplonema papillatum]|nr:hypothetical protein DIPPA_07912 [Diplonema papillatum]
MVPLRALLGSAAGEGPAPQIAFERDEGMRPDTYSIGITTHMEQTTLTARSRPSRSFCRSCWRMSEYPVQYQDSLKVL